MRFVTVSHHRHRYPPGGPLVLLPSIRPQENLVINADGFLKIVDFEGNTPLHYAVLMANQGHNHEGLLNVIKYLLEEGAGW